MYRSRGSSQRQSRSAMVRPTFDRSPASLDRTYSAVAASPPTRNITEDHRVRADSPVRGAVAVASATGGTRPKDPERTTATPFSSMQSSVSSTSKQRRSAKRSAQRYAQIEADRASALMFDWEMVEHANASPTSGSKKASKDKARRHRSRSRSTVKKRASEPTSPPPTKVERHSSKSPEAEVRTSLSAMSISDVNVARTTGGAPVKINTIPEVEAGRSLSTPNLSAEIRPAQPSGSRSRPHTPSAPAPIASRVTRRAEERSVTPEKSESTTALVCASSPVAEEPQRCEGLLRNVRPHIRTVECIVELDAHLIPGEYYIELQLFPFKIEANMSVCASHPQCCGSWADKTAVNPYNYEYTAQILDTRASPVEVHGTLALTAVPPAGTHVLFDHQGEYCYLRVSTRGLWYTADR